MFNKRSFKLNSRPSYGDGGFTLIEIAVVLAIMGILTAGAVTLLEGADTSRKSSTTKQNLEAAERAVENFYTLNNRLPCPANGRLTTSQAGYGLEGAKDGSNNCDITAVPVQNAVIPWRSLGLRDAQRLDGWGNVIAYRVSDNVVNNGDTADGDLEIRDDVNTNAAHLITNEAAYVLWSYGDRDGGAWTSEGVRIDFTGYDANETENADGDNIFIERSFDGNLLSEFDDLVHWGNRSELMFSAGVAFSSSACTSANTLYNSQNCSLNPTTDTCTVAMTVRTRCPANFLTP